MLHYNLESIRGLSSPSTTDDLTPMEQRLRVHLLLVFMDILEKMMDSATDGSSLNVIWNEWLSHNRFPLMNVCFDGGTYAQVIRIGSTALIDQPPPSLGCIIKQVQALV